MSSYCALGVRPLSPSPTAQGEQAQTPHTRYRVIDTRHGTHGSTHTHVPYHTHTSCIAHPRPVLHTHVPYRTPTSRIAHPHPVLHTHTETCTCVCGWVHTYPVYTCAHPVTTHEGLGTRCLLRRHDVPQFSSLRPDTPESGQLPRLRAQSPAPSASSSQSPGRPCSSGPRSRGSAASPGPGTGWTRSRAQDHTSLAFTGSW